MQVDDGEAGEDLPEVHDPHAGPGLGLGDRDRSLDLVDQHRLGLVGAQPRRAEPGGALGGERRKHAVAGRLRAGAAAGLEHQACRLPVPPGPVAVAAPVAELARRARRRTSPRCRRSRTSSARRWSARTRRRRRCAVRPWRYVTTSFARSRGAPDVGGELPVPLLRRGDAVPAAAELGGQDVDVAVVDAPGDVVGVVEDRAVVGGLVGDEPRLVRLVVRHGTAVRCQLAAVDRHVVVARTADVEAGGLDLAGGQPRGLAQQRRGVRDRQHRVLVLHREPFAAADAALERVGALAQVHAEVARALARHLDRADDGRGVRAEADAAVPADLVAGERARVDLHAVDARGDGHALDLDLDGVILRRPVVEGQAGLLGQRDRGDRHRPGAGGGRVRLALRVVEVDAPVRRARAVVDPGVAGVVVRRHGELHGAAAEQHRSRRAGRRATGPPASVPCRPCDAVARGRPPSSRGHGDSAGRCCRAGTTLGDDRLLLSDADGVARREGQSGRVGHDEAWTRPRRRTAPGRRRRRSRRR